MCFPTASARDNFALFSLERIKRSSQLPPASLVRLVFPMSVSLVLASCFQASSWTMVVKSSAFVYLWSDVRELPSRLFHKQVSGVFLSTSSSHRLLASDPENTFSHYSDSGLALGRQDLAGPTMPIVVGRLVITCYMGSEGKLREQLQHLLGSPRPTACQAKALSCTEAKSDRRGTCLGSV